MLNEQIKNIVNKSRDLGWILEPDAKNIMNMTGLDVPDFVLTNSFEEANEFLKSKSSPMVAKAVSTQILHKTEYQAVVTGITSSSELESQMKRLQSLDGCENILVEEMIKGIEVIIGAKNDYQFGPVIVFGLGGTSVEIYNDTAIRMAPLTRDDVNSMVESLTAKQIIKGYRGADGVNLECLTNTMVKFSNLVMELEADIESIDLNPVICTKETCAIADARIILKTKGRLKNNFT